jgi:hypothetical protein
MMLAVDYLTPSYLILGLLAVLLPPRSSLALSCLMHAYVVIVSPRDSDEFSRCHEVLLVFYVLMLVVFFCLSAILSSALKFELPS